MIDGKEHKFCRKCKNRKHGGKAMWRSDKYAHTTSEHLPGKEWLARQQAAKPSDDSSSDRSVTFSKDTEGQHPKKSAISTLVATPRADSPPPQASLRLISSLCTLSVATDAPRRPDPPSSAEMYEEEEEEVSMSPPRHFDDDSAADNYSIVSDESSLNYSTGRR
jgi:hypothetical protein